MQLIELVILGFSVSLDAFAVSVSGALTDREHPHIHAIIACIMFGFFQFLMPLIGGELGEIAETFVDKYDHYVAFLLLLLVGGKMIYEALKGEKEGAEEKKGEQKSPFDFPTIVVLAIATSLDAMAVGLSLKLGGSRVLLPALVMGGITGIVSFAGVFMGSLLGKEIKAEKVLTIIGGVAIILIGVKILLSHLL